MKSALKTEEMTVTPLEAHPESDNLADAVMASWSNIAPFWPLKNLIAVNPLRGLEHLPVEQALIQGAAWFQQEDIPHPMEAVNRETIKWLQAFFDEGQSTLSMPLRQAGLFASWLRLARFDVRLHGNNPDHLKWLASLSPEPEKALEDGLMLLAIDRHERGDFLTLLLTTLAGWASHIKYRTEWMEGQKSHPHPVSQTEYLAMRVAITCLLWPQAKALLDWHRQALSRASENPDRLRSIQQAESAYRLPLLKQLTAQQMPRPRIPAAQIVFCIDVRSEPFRRALEAAGDYETLGFAGFFGIPVQIENAVTGESYASCPVLLTPKHHVVESPHCAADTCARHRSGHDKLVGFQRFYQSLKYTFSTPFALVETMGLANGAWMGLRSLAPGLAHRLKSALTQAIRPAVPVAPDLVNLNFAQRCGYAEGALKMMGLTSHFAPLVVLCGHGSTTHNNAYATALDCGACGGRHGAGNARILAAILNDTQVRQALARKNILIPEITRFLAAEHNTTTDEVEIFTAESVDGLTQLIADLEKARLTNCHWRCSTLGISKSIPASATHAGRRSQDWAQVRPEWGLARNASFIAAPRHLTRSLNLEGRSFLHSYDFTQDPDGTSLTTILTAPMVVAQWINSQYLFSTLDNSAYGGGSKITKNITGKLGIMQGNASDLMTGLPLQSLFINDTTPYHEPQRLLTIVHAPRPIIDHIISAQDILQKLFGNGWVTLACIEPHNHQCFLLQRNLTWSPAHL